MIIPYKNEADAGAARHRSLTNSQAVGARVRNKRTRSGQCQKAMIRAVNASEEKGRRKN